MPVSDIKGLASGIAGAATNIVDAYWTLGEKIIETSRDAGRAISAVVDTVPQVLPQMLPAAAAALATLNYRGSQGSFIDIGYPITLAAKFMEIAPEARNKLGRPLMETRRINSLTGFCLCQNPQIVINGSIEEESAINDILAAGFYIE